MRYSRDGDQFKAGDDVYILGSRDVLLDAQIVERAGNSWLVNVSGQVFRISPTEIFSKHRAELHED